MKFWPCSGHLIKKSETTLPIAYSLSYNILKFGRKGAKKTEILDKEQCHADSCFLKKSPPIDITRKYEKLCTVAFNRKLTSSKWKINVIFLVENCLSYNISKSGRQLITGKRDNLNWTKTKMTSSKNTFIFLSLDANMMTLFHFVRVRVVWNCISNSCSFQPWYKNWILRLVLELFWFQKWHVFAHFCIILPIASRADFQLWRTLMALWKVKSDWNKWKLSIMVRGIQIMWKFWILTFSARCARGHVRTENFEML